MSKEKQIEFERNEMADILAQNFKLNDEKYDPSDFEWAAHCLQVAGYRKQSEWISVDERLPEEGKNVLCFENGKFYIAFFEKYEEGAWWDWVAYDRDDTWNEVCPSHWMPLPEPPKGD